MDDHNRYPLRRPLRHRVAKCLVALVGRTCHQPRDITHTHRPPLLSRRGRVVLADTDARQRDRDDARDVAVRPDCRVQCPDIRDVCRVCMVRGSTGRGSGQPSLRCLGRWCVVCIRTVPHLAVVFGVCRTGVHPVLSAVVAGALVSQPISTLALGRIDRRCGVGIVLFESLLRAFFVDLCCRLGTGTVTPAPCCTGAITHVVAASVWYWGGCCGADYPVCRDDFVPGQAAAFCDEWGRCARRLSRASSRFFGLVADLLDTQPGASVVGRGSGGLVSRLLPDALARFDWVRCRGVEPGCTRLGPYCGSALVVVVDARGVAICHGAAVRLVHARHRAPAALRYPQPNPTGQTRPTPQSLSLFGVGASGRARCRGHQSPGATIAASAPLGTGIARPAGV